jgi:lysophospholipase L1-like esterase
LILPIQQDSPALPKNLTLRILPLGDSITNGMGSSKGNSYRKDLYDKLTAKGARVEFVGSQKTGSFPQNDNEGWIGFTIEQISAKADNPKALGARPNLVLLLAGTNDITRNPNGAPQRLQRLAEKIASRTPGIVLLIGTIPPITSQYMPGSKGESTPLVNEFNAAIPKIAKTLTDTSKRVAVANHGAIKLGDLQDGIHPNDGGYSKMAAGWLKAIEEVAEKDWITAPS